MRATFKYMQLVDCKSGHSPLLTAIRGLRNSEIRFGIGISGTEPYRTELFLEFRKSRNSDFFKTFSVISQRAKAPGHQDLIIYLVDRYAVCSAYFLIGNLCYNIKVGILVSSCLSCFIVGISTCPSLM